MSFLKTIRSSMRGGGTDEDAPPQTESEAADQAVTDRFAKLNERDAVAQLHQLKQVELAAVEDYERANRAREPVLNKLRYLRANEPLPDYDTLEPPAIAEALDAADGRTIKSVREYERKMQNRADVNKSVIDALHRSHDRQAAAAPAGAAPEQPPVVGNGLPVRTQPESGLGTP